MASSDDESEVEPQSVSNYHFVDNDEAPISFSSLPIQWSESDTVCEKDKYQIFLHGFVDNGLRTIHKEVIAWKFDLFNAIPDISVLTKDKAWIKLQKPRKSFEEIIRTELITVQCLHYARRFPDASKKSVFDYLAKEFSLYDVKPSQNDLVDHLALVSEAVRRDDSLSKSKFLLSFLEEKPRKRKLSDEDAQSTTMSGFIVDDVLECDEEDESDGDELFDSVCAFCDNGGELLCCDGSCMRSFHAMEEAGVESMCVSLGFTKREVEALQRFYCKNCKYKQHQCFSCGELGSSDKSSGAEVFRCANATCGYFYHPYCIAKLLHPKNGAAAKLLEKKVAAGEESFTCPIHKCCVCKQGENKRNKELQFAVCRRCPTSYHRKCLPSEIVFETTKEEEEEEDEEEQTEIRAWDNLLPNRILIYCLKHEIVEDLGTPVRDIRFPDMKEKKKKQLLDLPGRSEEGFPKKRKLTSDDFGSGDTAFEKAKGSFSVARKAADIKKNEKISSGPTSSRKVKENDASSKSKETKKSSLASVDRSVKANVKKNSLGDKLFTLMTKTSEKGCSMKQDMHTDELAQSKTVETYLKKLNELPKLNADTERRLLALMEESASSISMEDIKKKHDVPSTHRYSLKQVVDKTISAGKVEGSVEAVRTALKKLEDGYSTEDAMAVCEPEVVNQVFKWKNKLKVHLAPFLCGMRYTSFGRHFTKVKILEEIVDILHWYVEDDDMIVDFCCGANDFSCLMKKKLEETGKRCSYKNYDIIQAKNDFNFEKRDWMTVRPGELPKGGSQLIMGLNPPFGVKSALANKFINKALEFKPKLLILIVPPETERLDNKDSPYVLLWEDNQFVSGKSFYLPGSVDENDKQMDQWNMIAPPLYLWSRPDWHGKHLAVAKKHGHLSRQQEQSFKKSVEAFSPRTDALELTDDLHVQNKETTAPNLDMVVTESRKECSPLDSSDRESLDGHGTGRSHFRNAENGERKLGRGTSEKLLGKRQNGGKPPRSESFKEIPHRSSPNMVSSRSSSMEVSPSASLDIPPLPEIGENSLPELENGTFSSKLPYRTTQGSSVTNNHDDVNRKYGMRSDDYSQGIPGFSHSNLDEQSTGHMRESARSTGYRSHFTDLRDSEARSQIRRYGQDPDISAQRNYSISQEPRYAQMGPMPSMPYGHLGAYPEPSYKMNMSAMQRYAPRLDELNHTMVGNFGPDRSMVNRNSMFDPRPPQPGNRVDSMNFAPGPYHSYSHRHSAGWLDE